jgi:hypothetical protein
MNLRLNPNNNLMRPPRSWRKRGRVAMKLGQSSSFCPWAGSRDVEPEPVNYSPGASTLANCARALKFHVSGVDMESPALPILSPIKAPKSGDSIKVAVAADERQGMLPAERGDPQIISRDRLAFLF